MKDRYDIEKTFNLREQKVFDVLQVIHNKLQTDDRIELVYVDDDVYMHKLIEYFYDNIDSFELVNEKNIYELNISMVLTDFIYSEDLAKSILEKVFTENLFMRINELDLDLSNIIDLKTLYSELIDSGIVKGNDIIKFISEEVACSNLLTFISEVINILRESRLPNENLIFLGWLKFGRILFLKYNTVME